jgi:thiol-disulfide isomerase/thioredoxin
VTENYGDSQLARRFGVKRYPAIFVDEVLVATPKDFGFYGNGEGEKSGGRYAPLKSAAAHERLRGDLQKIVKLVMAGRAADARSLAPSQEGTQIAALPSLGISDATKDRVVLVEFWATWCPPCRGTLSWLGTLKKKYGDRVTIVTVALESDPADVQKVIGNLPVRSVMGTPELARSFGDISAVPTLFVFDRSGRTAGVFYGAPPTLHAEAERTITTALR